MLHMINTMYIHRKLQKYYTNIVFLVHPNHTHIQAHRRNVTWEEGAGGQKTGQKLKPLVVALFVEVSATQF